MFLPHHLSQIKLQTEAFDLQMWLQQSETKIEMKMHNGLLYSSEIPNVKQVLESLAPSVLCTTCFNDKDLPFDEEVLHTELGHLFEHVLLDCLCEVKEVRDGEASCFSGTTSWNWETFGKGVFCIKINAGWADRTVLYEGLGQATRLFRLLLRTASDEQPVVSTSVPSELSLNMAH